MSMKVGVIGAGYWGSKHVDEYSQLPGADLQWVVDASSEARSQMESKFGVPNTTADIQEMLRSDVEAVSVCVGNDQHHEVARRVLEAGKHVLVEKPLTMSFETSQDLVDLAEEMDLTLAVGHIYRFNNAVDELRRRVNDGYFGDVYTLIARWTTLCDPFPGRDVVFDLAPHAFDIMNYTLGEWPERITCTGRAYRRPELEESAFITAEFPSGAMGHIEASWLLPGKVRSVELVGSERAAHIDALSQQFTIHESDRSFDAGVRPNNTIRDELQHFIEAVGTGDHTLNSGIVGRNTVRCVQAAVQSMREHTVVELDWD
jgi:predicted dehydrogenase